MNDSNVDTESTRLAALPLSRVTVEVAKSHLSARLRDRIDLEQQSREAAMEQLTIFIQQAVTTVSNRMEEIFDVFCYVSLQLCHSRLLILNILERSLH